MKKRFVYQPLVTTTNKQTFPDAHVSSTNKVQHSTVAPLNVHKASHAHKKDDGNFARPATNGVCVAGSGRGNFPSVGGSDRGNLPVSQPTKRLKMDNGETEVKTASTKPENASSKQTANKEELFEGIELDDELDEFMSQACSEIEQIEIAASQRVPSSQFSSTSAYNRVPDYNRGTAYHRAEVVVPHASSVRVANKFTRSVLERKPEEKPALESKKSDLESMFKEDVFADDDFVFDSPVRSEIQNKPYGDNFPVNRDKTKLSMKLPNCIGQSNVGAASTNQNTTATSSSLRDLSSQLRARIDDGEEVKKKDEDKLKEEEENMMKKKKEEDARRVKEAEELIQALQGEVEEQKKKAMKLEEKFFARSGEIKILRETLKKNTDEENRFKNTVQRLETQLETQQSKKEQLLEREVDKLKTQLAFKDKEVSDALEKSHHAEIMSPKILRADISPTRGAMSPLIGDGAMRGARSPMLGDGFTRTNQQRGGGAGTPVRGGGRSADGFNTPHLPDRRNGVGMARLKKQRSSDRLRATICANVSRATTVTSRVARDLSQIPSLAADELLCTHTSTDVKTEGTALAVRDSLNQRDSELLLRLAPCLHSASGGSSAIEGGSVIGGFSTIGGGADNLATTRNIFEAVEENVKRIPQVRDAEEVAAERKLNMYAKRGASEPCHRCLQDYYVGVKSIVLLKHASSAFESVRIQLLNAAWRTSSRSPVNKFRSISSQIVRKIPTTVVNDKTFYRKYQGTQFVLTSNEVELEPLDRDDQRSTSKTPLELLTEILLNNLVNVVHNKSSSPSMKNEAFTVLCALSQRCTKEQAKRLLNFLKLRDGLILAPIDCTRQRSLRLLHTLTDLLNCKNFLQVVCSRTEKCGMLVISNSLITSMRTKDSLDTDIQNKMIQLLSGMIAQDQKSIYKLIQTSQCKCWAQMIRCLVLSLYREFKPLRSEVLLRCQPELSRENKYRLMWFRQGIALLCKLCLNVTGSREKISCVEQPFLALMCGTVKLLRKIPYISNNEVVPVQDLLRNLEGDCEYSDEFDDDDDEDDDEDIPMQIG